MPKMGLKTAKNLQLSFVFAAPADRYNSGFRGALMKLLAQWLSRAIAAAVVILFCFVRPALADSYTIFNLGNDNGRGIYGIDATGDVVTWGNTGCGTSAVCYTTYVDGVATSDASTAPSFAYDNGTACSSSPAGFNAPKSVCNNGWIGLESVYSPNGDANGVYLGSESDPDFLSGGSADHVYLNAVGDFAWVNGMDDQMYVAILNSAPALGLFVQPEVATATTPEPGTLLLVATGLVGITLGVRRGVSRASRYHNLAE
jgi:PEP-CTERM motif